MTGALIGICALLGLAIGSFLNVVIYRVPLGLSVVSPPSACPHCHHEIRPYDNVPVLSWLILRGKCRDCATPISARYPAVEAACSALFAAVAWHLGVSWAVAPYCALMAGLLALALIDLDHLKLPKTLVWIHLALVGALLIVTTAIYGHWRALLIAVICSIVWAMLFFVINFVSPRLLGFGDVRFSLVLGLALGYLGFAYAAVGFLLANLIGLSCTIVLVATKRINMNQPVPYGVFLAIGTAVAFFAGSSILGPFHLNDLFY
jgi:leader peptidase (prepilin peptidase)/N-methyltransferase